MGNAKYCKSKRFDSFQKTNMNTDLPILLLEITFGDETLSFTCTHADSSAVVMWFSGLSYAIQKHRKMLAYIGMLISNTYIMYTNNWNSG